MPRPEDKRSIAVVTACRKAGGKTTFALTEVEVTPEEAENGAHHSLVEAELRDKGYEGPFLHFDERDSPALLHPAVRQFLGLPPTPDPLIVALRRSLDVPRD